MKNPTPQDPTPPTFGDFVAELNESHSPDVTELLPAHALDALALRWLIDPKRAGKEERSLAAAAAAVQACSEVSE